MEKVLPGVYSGVGATATFRFYFCRKQFFKRGFDNFLHCFRIVVFLPAAVVFSEILNFDQKSSQNYLATELIYFLNEDKISSTSELSSLSTITRTLGSVPDIRIIILPFPASFCSLSSSMC